MTGRERFLAGISSQPVDHMPVWFMRQAGRSLAEYRALRAKHTFMQLATTPELAAEATVMPVGILGVDAAVLFADIMLPLASLGVPFEIAPGVGPVIPTPIRSRADVERLTQLPASEATPYVLDALRLVKAELGSRAALLGFAGAPFTLACYLVEGRPSREFPRAKAMMYGDPGTWHALMERLTAVTIDYLREQVTAGADAVQLFDSWLGLLSPASFEAAVLPYTQQIFAAISPLAPTIHFSTGTATLLPLIAQCGCQGIGLDWRTPLQATRALLSPGMATQGNLDPSIVLAPWPVVEKECREVLAQVDGPGGHVFNLGHGILPASDPDILRRIVELVHKVG